MMNPPIFFGSKVNENALDFINMVCKVFYDMGLTSNDKAELVSYQLKDVAQTSYTQWRYNRALIAGPIYWEMSRRGFINHYFIKQKR